MSHWTETIKALEERASALEKSAQETRQAAAFLQELAPASRECHKLAKDDAAHKSEKRESVKDTRPIGPGPKNRKSEFRGVTPVLAYGETRYRATAWDREERRCISLGTFDEELEAAVAVAKYLHDGPEIQRISDLIEQKENNPDREKPSQATKTGMVWECRRCGHQHTVTERPEKCENCGYDALRRIA